MLSVTADTNVYVSAFNYGGKPQQLINMANAGVIRLDVSEDIIQETLHVLRDKFDWSATGLSEAEYQMRRLGRSMSPTERIDVMKETPGDNRILECAAAAKSDFIVTGDRHLLRLGKFRGMPVVKVADFLGIAQGRHR